MKPDAIKPESNAHAVRIGIIDSGIPESLIGHIPGEDFSGANVLFDKTGHGSAVLKPLLDIPNTQLFSARVFDQRLVCSSNQIVSALEWLVEQRVDLINMSFGLASDNPQLRHACQTAMENNITLIAAAPAQGQPVFPSAYPGVIRATGDARCHPGELSYLNSDQADFGGHPGNPLAGPAGASIGCAYTTAAIAQAISEEPAIKGDAHHLIEVMKMRSQYLGREFHQTPVNQKQSQASL